MSKINKSLEHMFDILLNIGMSPEKTGKPLCNNGMKGKTLYMYGGGDDSTKRKHAHRFRWACCVVGYDFLTSEANSL